jgi:hypothetical protein
MQLVILENEKLRLGVLAGKGADIVEINYKPRDLDLIWLTPGGVRNPVPHATTAPDSRGAFDEIYLGGWQEMFPNAGGAMEVDGIPHRYHGEVHSIPWDVQIVEDTPEAIAVTFSVRMTTSPCLIERTIRMEHGQAGFRYDEVARNDSPLSTTFEWGHHITFGQPFAGPGTRVTLPEGVTVHALPMPRDRRGGDTGSYAWPTAPESGVDQGLLPERGALSEMIFLTGFEPDATWYDVTPASGGPTCRVAWDGETMPVLWYWQEFGRGGGYPWFGRVYTVGLEPNSGIPPASGKGQTDFEEPLSLEPGAIRAFWLELSVREDDV